jgi:hypothetical protein
MLQTVSRGRDLQELTRSLRNVALVSEATESELGYPNWESVFPNRAASER